MRVSMVSSTSTGEFIGGAGVGVLEEELAAYIGVRQVVALNSGTDALILGMRASLVVATLCTLLAFGLFAWGMSLLHVGAKGFALLPPLAFWLAVLLPWLFDYVAWSPKQHQRGMYRALAAWAVTDLTVLYVFAT